jgi:glutamate--cysteine ligase
MSHRTPKDLVSTIHPTERDDPGPPLPPLDRGGLDVLVGWFAAAQKPRAAFRVGTEHEKFGFLGRLRGAGPPPAPLPFDGPAGIEALLDAIADDPVDAAAHGAWTRAKDGGRTIALFRGDASITLEPGGQFELSGAPFFSIHQTAQEVRDHLSLLRRHCDPHGIGFVGVGFHPTATWDELPLVPKSRYAVMTRYMPKVGRRGLDMMKRTATVQANYDWSSEADMVASYRAALAVAPLVAALFAHAPFVEGRPSGALSERQRVWADTDPRRTGFPAVVLAPGFSYERYVQWVLDVPMYFVRRDGVHHDVAGASFRTFLQEGIDVDVVGGRSHVRATLRDFVDHLTTLFPEVRLKRVLEVRMADVAPPARLCALPALYKGLLYDERARDAALALMDGVTGEQLAALRADVAVRGLRATFRGAPILERCGALVDAARAGLARQGVLDGDGRDESRYLQPLVDIVARGRTPAEDLLDAVAAAGSLAPVWDTASFWDDDGGARPAGS